MAIAGERRQARHQLEVAPQRAARLPEIERDRAEHAAVGRADRRRPAGAQTRGERGLAQVLPERVARDLGDDDLALQEDRGGAGTVARADLDLGDRVEELGGRRMPATCCSTLASAS